MFAGEALCLAVYYISLLTTSSSTGNQEDQASPSPSSHTPQQQQHSPSSQSTRSSQQQQQQHSLVPMSGWYNFLLWIPTLCDMTATTLMNVGLIFISASIYQMLRGSVVLFTGTFSVLFLNRRHPAYRWFALVNVFLGVALVGLSSM